MTTNTRAQRRKQKRRRFIFILFLTAIIIASTIFLRNFIIDNYVDSSSTSYKAEIPANSPYESNLIISPEALYSNKAILLSLDDDKILLDKSSNEKTYPASLTKIMTTIVAIENINDLNERVHLSQDMFNHLFEEGASMAGFIANDDVAAIDLLYGVMLPSGAEASIGLAEHISGSEKNFADLMNEKARELGMNNTNFTNTTGLHNRNHYSTVYDLSILLNYALKDETFREIFTSKKYLTGGSPLAPYEISFDSTMFKKMDTDLVNDGIIEGGKTGYTKEAQLCLASLANINGKEYILVTTEANGDHYTEQFNILDAYTVYNQISSATSDI